VRQTSYFFIAKWKASMSNVGVVSRNRQETGFSGRRSRRRIGGSDIRRVAQAAIAAAGVFSAVGAYAQTAQTTTAQATTAQSTVSTASSVAQAQPSTPQPAPPPSLNTNLSTGQGDDDVLGLQALGKPLGDALAEKGIYLTGRLLAEPQGAVSGGLKQGFFYEGYVTVGTDLDMSRIAGIEGGVLHFSIGDLQGQPYYSYTGSTYAFNRAWTTGDEVRLAELSWEQLLFDDHLRILAGRISPSYDFDTSSLYCQFAYTACSDPAAFIFDKSSTPYLTSAWGTAVTAKPSQETYVKAGAYENESFLAITHHDNWPGDDWGFNKISGGTFPAEIGYVRTPEQTAYPGRYDVGAYYDTSPYSDPFYNTKGESRGLYGGAPLTLRDRAGIYLQSEQTVWRPEDAPYRRLIAFAGANFGTAGRVTINNEFFGGLREEGPFSFRPHDNIDFSVQYMGLSGAYTDRLDNEMQAQGLDYRFASTETAFEFDYGVYIAPGIQFMPFVQYTVNPDEVAITIPRPLNNSVVVGAAITVSFNQAFGLPQLLRHPY
jgi:porin